MLDPRFFLATVSQKAIHAAPRREQLAVAHAGLAVAGNIVVPDFLEGHLQIRREMFPIVEVHAQALRVGIVEALAQDKFQILRLVLNLPGNEAGIDVHAAADRIAAETYAV
ncbi:hypothetical protein D3C72_1421650 [compost metagenome]